MYGLQTSRGRAFTVPSYSGRSDSGSRTRTGTASPSSSSKVVTAWPPTSVDTAPKHTNGMKPEHWETVKAALVGVNKEGTGARAFAGAAYTNGGKTGTAQVYSLRGEKYDAKRIGERLRDHALFIAYAPAEQPRIALSVLVENGGFGATAAAPIARQVMDYFLTGKIAKPTAPTLPPPIDDESD